MTKDIVRLQLNVSASEVCIELEREELSKAEEECPGFLLPADRFAPATIVRIN